MARVIYKNSEDGPSGRYAVLMDAPTITVHKDDDNTKLVLALVESLDPYHSVVVAIEHEPFKSKPFVRYNIAIVVSLANSARALALDTITKKYFDIEKNELIDLNASPY